MASLALAMMACGTGKDVNDTDNTDDSVEMVSDAINGTVKDMTKTDGCDFVIEVMLDGNTTLLEPLALDDKYKVDGKSVKLAYTPSRRASKCAGTMPITIQKITD